MKTDAVEDFGNLKVINGKMPRSSLTSIRKGGRTSPVSNVSSFEKNTFTNSRNTIRFFFN